jgi:hypothetical protein
VLLDPGFHRDDPQYLFSVSVFVLDLTSTEVSPSTLRSDVLVFVLVFVLDSPVVLRFSSTLTSSFGTWTVVDRSIVLSVDCISDSANAPNVAPAQATTIMLERTLFMFVCSCCERYTQRGGNNGFALMATMGSTMPGLLRLHFFTSDKDFTS